MYAHLRVLLRHLGRLLARYYSSAPPRPAPYHRLLSYIEAHYKTSRDVWAHAGRLRGCRWLG